MNRWQHYTQDVYWWDSEDREYTLRAHWRLYTPRNDFYSTEAPGDTVELLSLELESSETGAPDISDLLDEGGDIWRAVEGDFSERHATLEEEY